MRGFRVPGEWSRSSGNYRVAAFNLFVPPDLSERQFWDESPQAFEEHSHRGSVHYGPAWPRGTRQERAPGARARARAIHVVRGRGREYPNESLLAFEWGVVDGS